MPSSRRAPLDVSPSDREDVAPVFSLLSVRSRTALDERMSRMLREIPLPMVDGGRDFVTPGRRGPPGARGPRAKFEFDMGF